MEVLKVRAWNKVKKEWVLLDEWINLFVKLATIEQLAEQPFNLTLFHPDYDFERCLAIKDKNKKIIWENDIIKFTDEDGNESLHKIKFFSEDGYAAFDLVPHIDTDSNGISYALACGTIEVIGNIHENSGFLSGDYKKMQDAEKYLEIIYNLIFSYVNKDEDYPHVHELESLQDALSFIKNINPDYKYLKFIESAYRQIKEKRSYQERIGGNRTVEIIDNDNENIESPNYEADYE